MIKPKFLLSPGGTGVISLVVFGLLFGAHLFAELPLSAIVLLSVAMLVQPLWQQFGPGTLGTLPAVAMQVVLIAMITGLAFFLTYQASPPLDPYYPY
jgi:purine-cytosine permease-like protein